MLNPLISNMTTFRPCIFQRGISYGQSYKKLGGEIQLKSLLQLIEEVCVSVFEKMRSNLKRSKKNSIYRAEVLEEFRFLGAPSQFLVQKLDFEWFTFVPLSLNGISEVNLLYQLFKEVSVKVRSKSFC